MVKAALNEGAKVPAFCNVFSEANHNELEIFAHMQASQKNEYVVLFFEDKKDHKRIQDRMSICTDMFKEMRIKTAHFPIQSETVQSTLTSLLAGYYTSTYLALLKHAEPYKTPCIGKFKELLSKKK
jgi:glucose/mannose-6-phosphate isomerase